jgi:hypothetical protein
MPNRHERRRAAVTEKLGLVIAFLMVPFVIIAMSMNPSQGAEQKNVTCAGILTDQRTVGLSLGNCDLNALSDAELRQITDLCGQPNGVDEDANRTSCLVSAIAIPKRSAPGIMTATKLRTVTIRRKP